eukprot:COSAG01_NODE_118_length_25424_cov_2255.533641_16_plen_327_part_00
MLENVKLIENESQNQIQACKTLQDIEECRSQFLGKSGQVTDLLKQLGKVPPADKPKFGQSLNQLKQQINHALKNKQTTLETAQLNEKLLANTSDCTLPSSHPKQGHKHPIPETIDHIHNILKRMGFVVEEGPEIENEFYNFEALNIPKDHPARAMHDTFYLDVNTLMRTHTSPIQIRCMQEQKAPIRLIAPGKVYRCDADPTHSPVFHQIEGLYIDKNVSFANLKATLNFFLKELFGHNKKLRFRSSYFPFTEPSVEVDVDFNGKWLEILGAGMVHENVFKAVNYDPETTQGFAFGLGIERIAMLRHNIPDIRLFYENDLRFLRQF